MSPKASVASRLTTVMADLLHDGWPLSHVEGGYPQLIHPLANLLISLAEACSIVRRRATAGVSLDRSPRKLIVERCERGEQLVRRGGGNAEARAGRVMGGGGDRRARPPYAELPRAPAAPGDGVPGRVLPQHPRDRADVGIHHNMVACQVLVDERAVAEVDVIFLHQRRADAPYHAADHLRARCLRIENAAGREHAEHAPNAHLARVAIHSHFSEMRPEAGMSVMVVEIGRRG